MADDTSNCAIEALSKGGTIEEKGCAVQGCEWPYGPCLRSHQRDTELYEIRVKRINELMKTKWLKSGEDWYYPLHPDRQQDHLRVWSGPLSGQELQDHIAKGGEHPGVWYGAIVLDGEYIRQTKAQKTPEHAMKLIMRTAMLYLATLVASLPKDG
jgi:hypothetical protein